MSVRNGTREHVEFVSYTGKYPNLCSGTLTLRINGKEVRFNDKVSGNKKFWGPADLFFDVMAKGEWEINAEDLPEEFRNYAYEIDKVFNENVERGHCGGCI